MLDNLNHFQQRLIVGISSTVVLFIFIWLAPLSYFKPIFALITASVITLSVWEYYQIAKNKIYNPREILGAVCSFAYVTAVFLSTQIQAPIVKFLPEIVLWLTLALIFFSYFISKSPPLANSAITLFAIGYLVIPLATLVNIIYFFPSDSPQDGRWWITFLILVTKMTDTGAFFVGRTYGHHKLAPSISPGKSWEGAIAGFIAALVTGTLMHWFTPINLSLFTSLCLAGVLSIVAQFGDLAESLIKRDAGVKDSNQIPGLGGMLDIVDSLVFTAPLMYIYLKLQF